MNIRIAKKICKAIGTLRGKAYTSRQLNNALDMIERTKDAREANAFWDNLIGGQLSIGDRAAMIGERAPGLAFGLLMRFEEEDWVKTEHEIRKQKK